MKQTLTREQAIALGETKFWETMSHRDIAMFQLFQERLCVPFSVYHEALEKALGRPVFTHELGMNPDGLRAELLGQAPAPTFEQVLALIPADKRIVLVAP